MRLSVIGDMEHTPQNPEEQPEDSIVELERMLEWALHEELRLKLAGAEEVEETE